jgi:hypothetical protein
MKTYKSKHDFSNMMLLMIRQHKEDQLIKKYLNVQARQRLVNFHTPEIFFNLFISLGEKRFNEFVKPHLFACASHTDFNYFLSHTLHWNNKWNINSVIDEITHTKAKADVAYNNDNLLILEIHNFEAAQILGTHAWCISREEKFFNSHKNTIDRLFFIFDFSKEQYDKTSLIGVTIPEAPIICFKYSFNCHNEPQKFQSLQYHFQNIIYKEPFNSDKFVRNVSLIKDPVDQFSAFFDMEFTSEAQLIFQRLLNEKSYTDHLFFTCNYILFEKRDNEFLLNYIDNFPLDKRELNALIHSLSILTTDLHFTFDEEFLIELFKKINNNDAVLDFMRNLIAAPHTATTLKLVINKILTGTLNKEYSILYAFKIKKEDTIEKLFKLKTFNKLNMSHITTQLSSEQNLFLSDCIRSNYDRSHPLNKRLVYNKIKYYFNKLTGNNFNKEE